jgi:hypothetical protein
VFISDRRNNRWSSDRLGRSWVGLEYTGTMRVLDYWVRPVHDMGARYNYIDYGVSSSILFIIIHHIKWVMATACLQAFHSCPDKLEPLNAVLTDQLAFAKWLGGQITLRWQSIHHALLRFIIPISLVLWGLSFQSLILILFWPEVLPMLGINALNCAFII